MDSFSHGVGDSFLCMHLNGATESSMSVQVEENRASSSSALTLELASRENIGEALKAVEKCPAVEGLTMRESRLVAQRGGTEHGTDIVNAMGEWHCTDFSNGDRNTKRQHEI